MIGMDPLIHEALIGGMSDVPWNQMELSNFALARNDYLEQDLGRPKTCRK